MGVMRPPLLFRPSLAGPICPVYAKVSTRQQKADMQIHELRNFVKRSGWKLYKELVDEEYSGKDTKRPEYIRMMVVAKDCDRTRT
jgi:DNA invertase Pin-like site-specific DNA recombinase